MLAPKARAKILRYFARKQPVTSPFQIPEGEGVGNCRRLLSSLVAWLSGQNRTNLAIFQYWRNSYYDRETHLFMIHYCQISLLCVNVKEMCHKLITIWQYSSVIRQKSQNYRKRPVTEIKSQTNEKKPGKSQTFSWKILRPDTFRKSQIRGVWP